MLFLPELSSNQAFLSSNLTILPGYLTIVRLIFRPNNFVNLTIVEYLDNLWGYLAKLLGNLSILSGYLTILLGNLTKLKNCLVSYRIYIIYLKRWNFKTVLHFIPPYYECNLFKLWKETKRLSNLFRHKRIFLWKIRSILIIL